MYVYGDRFLHHPVNNLLKSLHFLNAFRQLSLSYSVDAWHLTLSQLDCTHTLSITASSVIDISLYTHTHTTVLPGMTGGRTWYSDRETWPTYEQVQTHTRTHISEGGYAWATVTHMTVHAPRAHSHVQQMYQVLNTSHLAHSRAHTCYGCTNDARYLLPWPHSSYRKLLSSFFYFK